MHVRTRRPHRQSALLGLLTAFVLIATPTGGAAVLAGAAPTITAISPTEALPGASVAVSGNGFGGPGVKVAIGGVQASIMSATGKRVVFTVPAAAPVGRTTLVLTAPSRQTARASFTVRSDGRVTPVVESHAAVSATVGRSGGSLESQGVRLAIPEGALSSDVVITLTPLRDLVGSPLDGTIAGGALLEPSGLAFLRPAILTFPLPAGVAAHQVLGFATMGDADLHLVPRVVSDGIITIPVLHFSTAGGSTGGTAAAALMSLYQPSSFESTAEQAIAIALAACAQEQALQILDGPACAERDGNLLSALRTWYLDGVKPRLEAAIGAFYPTVEGAFVEWLRWGAAVQEWAEDAPLTSEQATAEELARRALEGVARTRLGNCTGTDVLPQLRDVARISDMARAGALAELAPDLPSALDGGLISACAHVELVGVDLPQVVAAGTDENTLSGRAIIDFYNGPDRVDSSIAIDVRGDDIAVSGSTALDASGAFKAALWITSGVASVRVDVTAMSDDETFRSLDINTDTVTLPRSARARIVLEASDVDIAPGETSNVLARLAGDDLVGRAIAFSVAGDGSVSPTSRVTDADGEAAATYTAPSISGNATVTASLQDADVTRTTSVEIVVSGEIAVSVTPSAAILAPSAQQTFSASVTGTADTAVTWSATCGTITSAGLYSAPGTPTQCVVTATSQADPAQSATATVSVAASGLPSLTVSPMIAYTAPGGHLTFTADLTNLPGASVLWSTNCGTIDSSGGYTAPATLAGITPGWCRVTARSSDGSLTVTANVEIGVVALTSATGSVYARAQDFASDPTSVEDFHAGTISDTASATLSNDRFTAELGLSAGVASNVLTIDGTASHDGSGTAVTSGVAGSAAGTATATFNFVVSGGRVPWSLVVDGSADATTDALGQASTTVNYRLHAVHLDPTASITSTSRGLLTGGIAVTGARDLTRGIVGYENALAGVTDEGWLTPGRYVLEIYLSGVVTPFYAGPGVATSSGSLTSAFSAGAQP